MNEILSYIEKYKKELLELNGSKKSKVSSENLQKDNEAELVLEKLVERNKKKDKNSKIVQFVYRDDVIITNTVSKKGPASSMINSSIFAPLNTPMGIERINNVLALQNQTTAKKSENKIDNAKISENIKEIESNIEKEIKKLAFLQKEISKDITNHFKTLPDDELLNVFCVKDEKNVAMNELLKTCGNFGEATKTLAKSFEKEEKIWDYVKDEKYYDLIKDVVRFSCDKDSIVYKAMSKPLKDLISIREIALYGLKHPDKESIEEMNKLLENHGYRISPKKINISNDPKKEDFRGKSGTKIAEIIIENAQKPFGDTELSGYKRNYLRLGLMYCLGEGNQKNDDTELFKKYMAIYFDKKNISSIDTIKLTKDRKSVV